MDDPQDPEPRGSPSVSTVVVSEDEVRRRQLGRLFVRARDGDRHAFNEIAERLMPLVWNVARAQGLDAESAMDVAQTSWVTLLEELDKIRSPESLAGWLITVTCREARRVRSTQRRVDCVDPQSLSDLPSPAGDIESEIADQEQYISLWRNLRKLPRRCQELLRIVAFVDRPDYSIVSEALGGMPRGSIGPTRRRCLDKLRELLDDDPTWSM